MFASSEGTIGRPAALTAAPIGYWTNADTGERRLTGSDTSCACVAAGGAMSAALCGLPTMVLLAHVDARADGAVRSEG